MTDDIKEKVTKLNEFLASAHDENTKKHAESMTLLKLVDEYVGARSLSPNTILTYKNLNGVLKAFLKDQYGVEDISLPEITLQFMYRFEIFLLNYENPNIKKKKFKPGTAILYRQKLKAVIEYATEMLYYTKNPFDAWRDRKVIKMDKAAEIKRVLSPEQLDAFDKDILKGVFKERYIRLIRPRLLFLLQTWTGFAYTDLEKNKFTIKDLIRTDNQGKQTIFYNRGKGGSIAIVPVFPQTKKILEELEYNLEFESYQGFYNHVRQLFTLYGLPKTNVGAHTGRHAFGERMLHMGFQMSDVSRMMGHTSIAVTEKVYAKVDSTKIWSSYERIQAANSAANPPAVE